MSIKDNDPCYYAGEYDEDGNYGEPHGYWLQAPDYEFKQRLIRMSHEACDAGIACWLNDNPNYSDIPF